MTRVEISFGKIDYNHTGRRNHLVTVDLELRDTKHGPEFSCRGTIWNTRKTDCVCGGQCLDTIAEYVKAPLFREILRFWKLYHLNSMHAGTPEQEAAIKIWEDQGNRYEYKAVCEMLKDLGLYEVEHEGKPYKYGHGWLYQPIPEADLQRIREIIAKEAC